MGIIESHSATAGQIATGISNAATGISSIGAATKDATSVYHGNNDASSHIDYELDYNKQATAKLQQFVSLIQSMASEFEAVDLGLSQALELQIPASPMTTVVTSRPSLLGDK